MGEDHPDGIVSFTPSLELWVRSAVLAMAIGVLVGSITYRQFQRRRTARFHRAKLASADPQVRAQGAVAWAEFGLHRCAPDLLRTLESESDATVRQAIVKAVRMRAWEPNSSRRTQRLRAECARLDQPPRGDA